MGSLISTLAEAGVNKEYVKDLQSEHEAAARCVTSVLSLSIAVAESTTEASRFMGTDNWDKTLTKLGNMKSEKIRDNVKKVLESYVEAYISLNKTLGSEGLQEELKKAERALAKKEDEEEEEEIQKPVTETLKEAVSIADNCAQTALPDSCILRGNPVAVILKAIGIAANPGEDSEQVWFGIYCYGRGGQRPPKHPKGPWGPKFGI